jgi:broad specificity phosphatase PhoE
MINRALLSALLVLALALPVAAQQTIFLVRHAERADGGSNSPTAVPDPDLSDAGLARAASLAAVLEDAGITAIFATEFKRTQQTAAPLAKSLGLPVINLKSTDTAALLAQLKAAKGNALVVGHSNTIPAIAKALGISSAPKVDEDEHDKLFIVTAAGAPGGSRALITLHYR